jgi:hypothetical protein
VLSGLITVDGACCPIPPGWALIAPVIAAATRRRVRFLILIMYIGVVYNFRGLKIPILIRIMVVFTLNYVHLLDFGLLKQDYKKI